MPIHQVIDSNVFIYSLLKNHPAYSECSSYLAWLDEPDAIFTTIESLRELGKYQIMIREIIARRVRSASDGIIWAKIS
ncbi:MAG: hypothetical protein RBG13Loki_0004 [Promethearchaeota archaeon CR_4]|nr:MAG: hypothetical protein RBG13Loki_0004 [Candidatus Lokiarchaeota archaeon CR_4]